MSSNEAECPNCGALINVGAMDDYELVKCYLCEEEVEFVDGELIAIEL